MKKPRLTLLDANVVIYLFKLGIWESVTERCEVHLARTVVHEAHFYEDDEERRDFDLEAHARQGRIRIFDVLPSQLGEFRSQFGPQYFEKLHAGETESLAFLVRDPVVGRLCSADGIVFRVLGNLQLGEASVSLEQLLREIGLSRPLPRQFTEAFRKRWLAKGFEERMRGIGLRDRPLE